MRFTLSAADNHWADLHKLLMMDGKEHSEFETEAKKAKCRHFLVRKHPHIVDHCFCKRVQVLLESCLWEDSALAAKWTWFWIEHQEQGTAQAHGCLSWAVSAHPKKSLLLN
jgi:hypothetical protein